jgi:ParB-like nuclease family protein
MTAELDVDVELIDALSTEDACSSQVDMMDRLLVFQLPLSSLRPGFFLRQSGTDAAHVQLLADAASSEELPAILVQKSSLRIVDGMHRIEAAKLRGERSINARLVDCSDEEAFMLAVRSNTLHGLPLSRADRIAGAKRILDWHADWSDRAVAAATGLSPKTIASLRYHPAGDVKDPDKRLGRDGKRRPVTGIEGRKRAADYLTAHPGASLREVAREVDISLGTVHDVRSRLRLGVDPIVGRGGSSGQRAGADPDTDVGCNRSSGGNGAGLSAGRQTSLCASWSVISPKLAKDPTIRYAEGGRTFLRWMTSRVMQPGEWKDFVDAVPAHWKGEISLIAEGVADEWREFAGQLRARQSPAI